MSVSTLEWPENLVLRISTRSVSSRSVVRGCRPVPKKTGVAGGGAGGIRVPVIVTAVCVEAAVADSVDGSLRQMIMRTVRSVFPLGYTFRIR